MNPIKTLEIENFTAFRKATLEFAPGINVFIGENSTGKTHVLKAIYALLRSAKWINDNESNRLVDRYEQLFYPARKLGNVFQPKHMGWLVRLPLGQKRKSLTWYNKKNEEQSDNIWAESNLSLKCGLNSQEEMEIILWEDASYTNHGRIIGAPHALYIPNREILSIYPGFIGAYNNRESAFDETYYDLCVALNSNPLRETKYVPVKHIVAPLEGILGGENKVIKKDDHFYIDLPDSGQLEAQLVAEGYRKIAELVYLIRNGSLAPGMVLLWDEPEANLNPKLVDAVVEFLLGLSKAGIQVFITTHDYLFAYKFSVKAEYKATDVPIKFFSFYREEGVDGVQIESGDTMADIHHNPILQAYSNHYDQESALFYADVPTTDVPTADVPSPNN